jgi:putative transposase
MKKLRFTENQIVGILKEADSKLPMADLLRTHEISGATSYNWRSKYGSLETSELKRVKNLDQQISEYKTMVAELSQDNRAVKNLIEKALAPTGKCDAVDTWLAKRRHPIHELALIWGLPSHRSIYAQAVELRPMNPSLRT